MRLFQKEEGLYIYICRQMARYANTNLTSGFSIYISWSRAAAEVSKNAGYNLPQAEQNTFSRGKMFHKTSLINFNVWSTSLLSLC